MSKLINSSACFDVGPRISLLNLVPSTITEEDLKKRSANQAKICADPLERIKLNCLSKSLTTFKNLARHFKAEMDENGLISLDKIMNGLAKFNIDADKSELKSAIQNLSTKFNNENFLLDVFLNAIKPEINSNRRALIDETFKNLDSKGQNFCGIDELRNFYNYKKQPQFLSGEKSQQEIFELFLKKFDISAHSSDNKITKDDFLNYYSALSAGIEADIYFDLVMRNTWKI